MANILKNKVTVDFKDKVWSTSEVLNSYPWALVGIESEAVFNGTTGGIDTYSNLTKSQWNAKTDYSQAITIGKMGDGEVSGKLTINGGVYMAPGTCVYAACGTAIINGGTFFAQPDSSQKAKVDAEKEKYGPYRVFTLNLYDSYGKSGKAAIYVTGGTFYGFDPADNYAEGAGTNFVVTGYSSYKTDETYTYMIKDANRTDNGTLTTVPVYKVVKTEDLPEGVTGKDGNKTLPTE